MKFGIQLAGGAPIRTRTAIQAIATAAEDLGFDSLLIGDHIVIPKKINAPWPYTEYFGGKTPYGAYTEMEWFDPFDTMAFLAGITEKVRLGISVLIVPYRHPFDVARRVATIDALSGGRFVLGVGDRYGRKRNHDSTVSSFRSLKISICYLTPYRNRPHPFGWGENLALRSSVWLNSAMAGISA